jgi:hypothetical protein
MQAYEFSSVIDNGIIRVPEEYAERLSSPVKIIILANEDSEKAKKKAVPVRKSIEWLKEPWKIDGFKPLTREEIYDRP